MISFATQLKSITTVFIVSYLLQTSMVSAQENKSLVFDFAKQSKLTNTQYSNKKGFGFDNFKNSTENAFSINVKEGNYKVTLEVKSTTNNNSFMVFSEDRRVMSPLFTLNKDEIKKHTFFVNVKNTLLDQAEQDNSNAPRVRIRGNENISRNWDEKLTIALSNQSIQFQHINIEPVLVAKVLLAGDSTVSDQASNDYASWGQFMPRLITNRLVVNNARSGETLKSFIASLRWDKTLSQTQAGDIVLIQFAHNDEKKQWPRTYAAADGAYPEYLRAFIADVRQKGAYPVLVTPVARRIYNKSGKLINTHEGYDQAVRNVAQATKVPFIDLTVQTEQLYKTLGKQNAPKIFASQGKDKTHHNHLGALLIADMVAKDLHAIYPELTKLENSHINLLSPDVKQAKVFTKSVWPNMRHIKVKISGS